MLGGMKLVRCGAVLLVLVAVGFAPGRGLAVGRAISPVPVAPAADVRERLALAGLLAEVTVDRDARGVPYLEAANDADLYFAQGYVMASDRLWQMDLYRRVARGETAELFGKQALEEDKRWRRYGFAAVAEEGLKHLSPELIAALEAYSRGVNAYIATLDEKTLPLEFRILQSRPRDWRPADSLVIGKILAEALSTTYQQDLVRESVKGIAPEKLSDLYERVTPYDVILFGKDAASTPAKTQSRTGGFDADIVYALQKDMAAREASLSRVGLFAEDLAASNNWVISGKRTADGRPILANDPHLRPGAPGIWYMAHLRSPSMRVAGVTLPGVPGVVIGHNGKIAWGATNVGPDVQDLYLLTFNDEGKYRTPAGWAEPVIRKEEIRYRANPLNTATQVEVVDVMVTNNGPVIIESGEKRYAMRWTAFDPANAEFESFFRLNRAGDWEEFKTALSTYGGAMQNFIYADEKGNIGWYAAGKIPIRRKGEGDVPYDAATNEGDWVGVIPFEELPHLYNPPQGFIMTANQRIVGTRYKHSQLLRDFATPWRARRLQDILSKDTKATMDSTTAAQMDVLNLPFSRLAKHIVSRKAASEESLVVMRGWGGQMMPEQFASLLVNEIRNCAATKIAESNEPVPMTMIRERVLQRAMDENLTRWLPKGYESFDQVLRECDAGTAKALTERYGEDKAKWNWGRLSAARFPHPLAAIPLIGAQFATPNTPIAGSGQTPNVGSSVSMRFVASPGNWDATRLVIPLGQSGIAGSAHYVDQFPMWSSGEPAVFPYTKEAVNKAAVSSMTIVPAAAKAAGN